jgi:hypothetical protein
MQDTFTETNVKVKLSQPWRRVWGVGVQLHTFLALVFDAGGQFYAPTALPAEEESPVPIV